MSGKPRALHCTRVFHDKLVIIASLLPCISETSCLWFVLKTEAEFGHQEKENSNHAQLLKNVSIHLQLFSNSKFVDVTFYASFTLCSCAVQRL